MPNDPQVAVFGCGYWGRNLVRNLHAMGNLAMVCDPNPSAREAAGKLAPDVPVFPDYAAAIGEGRIAAVMLATPAATHAELGLACLRAGKHLFVEKPLALEVGDAERLVAAAEGAKRVLMVGHLLEYHPAVVRLQELLAKGHFGKLQYLYSSRLNFGKIRTEENALWSFAPHDVAVILRLVGARAAEATCVGGAYITPGLPDVTVSTLSFEGGVRAHIHVSWLHPYKEQRLVLVGSERMAVFDDTRAQDKLVVYDQQVEWQERVPVPKKGGVRTESLPADEPLRVECEHFVACVRKNRAPLTDGRSGVEVLRVLHACQRSLDAHGRPFPI